MRKGDVSCAGDRGRLTMSSVKITWSKHSIATRLRKGQAHVGVGSAKY